MAVASSSEPLGAGTAEVRRRLARFSAYELGRLKALRPEDVSDGTILVRLSLGEYINTMSRHRRLTSDEIGRYLTEWVPAFAKWQTGRIVAVSRAFELRRYPDGHVVYRQGDVGE